MIFETDRVLVRHLDDDDLDLLFAVYSDPEAMRWVGDGQPISREDCLKWLDVTKNNYDTRGYGMSVLVLRETGAVFGFCGIVHPGGQPEAEIKYALLKEYWGRGLATEIVAGMLAWGARTFELTRIIATTAPKNVASHRVLLKSGMKSIETRREEDGTFTRVFAWHAPNWNTSAGLK